ncbi:MAG TPA: DUF6338 family protein [Ktedonobacterales bacterium]|nr:DUF6338 family protein [Ktedonobacterales bacterium]
MFPTDLSGLLIILLFLVPGLITRTVIATSIPRHEQGAQAWLVEIMLFSAIGFVIFAVFYGILLLFGNFPPMDLRRFPPKDPPLLVAALFYVFFFMIVPLVLGYILVVLFERGFFSRTFERLRVKAAHPAPRAWDYFFSQQQQALVVVSLTNGEKLAGYMGGASFASSYPANEDLFLERQLRVSNGTITGNLLPNTKGVWIQGSQICCIEFYEAIKSDEPDSVEQGKIQ